MRRRLRLTACSASPPVAVAQTGHVAFSWTWAPSIRFRLGDFSWNLFGSFRLQVGRPEGFADARTHLRMAVQGAYSVEFRYNYAGLRARQSLTVSLGLAWGHHPTSPPPLDKGMTPVGTMPGAWILGHSGGALGAHRITTSSSQRLVDAGTPQSCLEMPLGNTLGGFPEPPWLLCQAHHSLCPPPTTGDRRSGPRRSGPGFRCL